MLTAGKDTADVERLLSSGWAGGVLRVPAHACVTAGQRLGRRADAVTVIGAALVCAAGAQGSRRIAERLGRPAATVRGWLRPFTSRAEVLRSAFTSCRASWTRIR